MSTQNLCTLSQVNAGSDVVQRLSRQLSHGLPLALFLDCLDAPMDAWIYRIDSQRGTLKVLCECSHALAVTPEGRYAAIGVTPDGERYMGSGHFLIDPHNSYAMHLTVPGWLDVMASNGHEYDEPIRGVSLHIGVADPHQNDLVCRVLELNESGVVVDWDEARNGPPPIGGDSTRPAQVFVRRQWVYLGCLDVSTTKKTAQGLHVELSWNAGTAARLRDRLHALLPSTPLQLVS